MWFLQYDVGHTHIYRVIHEKKVNILGGDSIFQCERKKSFYEHVYNSEWFARYSFSKLQNQVR